MSSMEIRCKHPHPKWTGDCDKLLVVYRNGMPYVSCPNCCQETEIPLKGKTAVGVDTLSATA